jgi:hypothetical protein
MLFTPIVYDTTEVYEGLPSDRGEQIPRAFGTWMARNRFAYDFVLVESNVIFLTIG